MQDTHPWRFRVAVSILNELRTASPERPKRLIDIASATGYKFRSVQFISYFLSRAGLVGFIYANRVISSAGDRSIKPGLTGNFLRVPFDTITFLDVIEAISVPIGIFHYCDDPALIAAFDIVSLAMKESLARHYIVDIPDELIASDGQHHQDLIGIS